MADLLYPYSYCRHLRTYLRPDDDRVVDGRNYYVGDVVVRIRRPQGKRAHFFEPNSAGGRGSGGGGGGPETAAHIFAKAFYKAQMFFSATINRMRILVRFNTCEVEQRMDERTPDIMATISECYPPIFPIGGVFLIEIHATHAVDDDPRRRPALQALGYPCVEVHLPPKVVNWNFNDSPSSQNDFEKYMRRVLADPKVVTWIAPDPSPRYDEGSGPLEIMGVFNDDRNVRY